MENTSDCGEVFIQNRSRHYMNKERNDRMEPICLCVNYVRADNYVSIDCGVIETAAPKSCVP